MWMVMVNQDTGSVKFGFNEMSDAIQFVSDCLECGNEGTTVAISELKED